MFGNPETTTGGNALKFYASVRLDIRRTSQLKDGDTASGNRVKVRVVKTRLLLLSELPNLISCLEKESPKRERLSI